MSYLPIYVDEWGIGVDDSKIPGITSFLNYMEYHHYQSVLWNGKPFLGWNYFALDDTADRNFGIRYIRNDNGPHGNRSASFGNVFIGTIKYRPFAWAKVTVPAGHYMTGQRHSVSGYSYIYDGSTAGSSDWNYNFMWITNLETVQVRTTGPGRGSVGITGYFLGTDTLGSLKPGRSYVNVYVLDSSGQTIIATWHALQPSETDGQYHYKSFDIGGLTPGSWVKIGIGRADSWSYDWHLYFAFNDIKVWWDYPW
jgi:hypothetical protein